MALDLFAGLPVRDYARALDWCGRLLGAEPAIDESYADGVRKVTCRDPDGNEVGFGGAPQD